jgi:hypothetical protein
VVYLLYTIPWFGSQEVEQVTILDRSGDRIPRVFLLVIGCVLMTHCARSFDSLSTIFQHA